MLHTNLVRVRLPSHALSYPPSRLLIGAPTGEGAKQVTQVMLRLFDMRESTEPYLRSTLIRQNDGCFLMPGNWGSPYSPSLLFHAGTLAHFTLVRERLRADGAPRRIFMLLRHGNKFHSAYYAGLEAADSRLRFFRPCPAIYGLFGRAELALEGSFNEVFETYCAEWEAENRGRTSGV